MSSDYLLEKLGYDPDQSAKRLGDGLYEQRLIQQAVTARTGQAFIDGQTSNEGMFKYLMNNAIASKDALNLSVGVGLTSQQVAALTHDIVWLEEHEVNGEKVLVPVVYLAQANGRLGPTGALIAGNDVTLIAGENLDNVGTLKATNNLSATAGNNLINSGLIQAGNRLDLLATNDIINKSGGIITGREVSLNTLNGDVINERSITSSDSSTRFGTQHHDFADTAARIEATNDLSIMSGRDINISGGVLQSGRDMDLDAERDLNIAATQVTNSVFHDSKHNNSDVTQLGANVNAGRDFTAQAGRDLAVIASQIDAKRDVSMSAAENLIISSAADEQHSLSKSKKLTVQEDHVSQVMSGVTAGGSVALSSGEDLTVVSSRVTAGDEAYLVAGNNLNILAAQDTDYSLYDKKKKGSFGSSKTKRDEVTKVDNIGSVITSGGDMVLVSDGDQHYQAAKLDSGNDLTITSGGSVTFEGVKDLHQESHEKSSSSSVWSSAKGRGNTDETMRQTELTANGNLVINAIDGLNIDLRDINQKSVSQTIDAMVKADPGLAWLKDAEKRGDVDWRMVKETHESFKYSNSGMGPAAMLAVVIIVSVLTAGTGTAATIGATAGQAASSAAIAAGASASTAATIAAAASAAATAAFSAAVGQAATSAINNKGNLGDTFKDVISSESFKSYVFAAITAGIASKFGYNPTDLNFDLDSVQSVAMKATFDALAKTAIMGGSLQDNLVSSALGSVVAIGGAVAANKIGDITVFDQGKVTKVVMHAALGGLMAEAMGGDFRTGAIAAGANEALVDFLADKLLPVGVDKNSAVYQQGINKLLAASQLVGVLTAAITGGDASTAAAVTANATQYNNLDHPSAERLLKELEGCRSTAGCSAQTIRDIITKYEDLSAQRSMAINDCKSRACVEEIQSSAVSLDTPVAKDLLNFLRRNVAYDMPGLLTGNPGSIAVPSQGVDGWGALFTSDKQMAFAKNLAEGWLTPSEMALADQWAKDTSWLDQQAGQPLTLHERATLMTELQMAAGILLIGRSPASATAVEFVPKWTRNSSGQIDAFTTPAEAIKMLEANGYDKTFSKDGRISILTKGDRTYRFYPESTSTKEPSASLDIAGIKKTIVKIRFKGK